ncbi:MAG: virulence-associated E family protein, partial [Pseudomonadota bacterium]
GQLVYLPNRGEHYAHKAHQGSGFTLLTPEHPIIVRRKESRSAREAAEREAAEAQRQRAERRREQASEGESPVETFNARHSVAQLLDRYGYKQGGGDDWRSPMQTSGTYATHDYGNHWVSLSGSDAAAGIGKETPNGYRQGDAFDLFVHFEHNGDFKAAVRAWAEESGTAYKPDPSAFFGKTTNKGREVARPVQGLPACRHDGFTLVRGNNNLPIWNASNALTLLSSHGDWQGVLAFDTFSRRRVLLRPIPGRPGGAFPRALEDDDYTAAQAWFNQNGFPRASMDIVTGAVRMACHDRSFDPLQDYLNSLEWDGAPRLGSWLTRYCGAEASAYTEEVGKRWCISAVARGFEPGCKADHMLVLEGAQGRRKSSALRALAGEEWFSDALPPMGTKDAQSYLRGRWIIEVGELEAMRKEVDAIKAFLTRRVETYRPAYGREEVSEPRRCVFAGTTNKDDWQRDETGGRRFWPVRVGEVDVPAIERDRDQLWAEAVSLYRAGERWWLEGDAAEAALAEAADRRPEDPWRADIEKAIAGRSEVSAKEILERICILPAQMTPQMSRRVGQELVALGWERAGHFTSGEYKALARFVRGKSR